MPTNPDVPMSREEQKGLRAKIIGFNKRDGEDYDCLAIKESGERILVDPFAGCSWKYEDRKELVGEWFEDEKAFYSENGKVWLTSEHSFRLLNPVSPDLLAQSRAEGYEQALEDARLYAKRLGSPSYADFVAAKKDLITQYQDGEKNHG